MVSKAFRAALEREVGMLSRDIKAPVLDYMRSQGYRVEATGTPGVVRMRARHGWVDVDLCTETWKWSSRTAPTRVRCAYCGRPSQVDAQCSGCGAWKQETR